MGKRIKIFLLIIGTLIIVPIAALIILSEVQNKTARMKAVKYINQELGDNIAFEDFSLSFLRHFPKIHFQIEKIAVTDRQREVLSVGKLDVLLDLSSIWKKELNISKVIVSNGILFSEVDSLGNKLRLFKRKPKKPGEGRSPLNIDSQDIRIIDSKVYFGNQIKSNGTYISVNEAVLKAHVVDSLIVLTGSLDAVLDSLISNNTLLFAGQPVKGEEMVFKINRKNGTKGLVGGYVMAHTLKLFPRFRMSPHADGQNIELHISGDGNFNAVLDLFEFNVGIDLEQTNPDAELRVSYNQVGFVNPFLRPYSELDFEILDGNFIGAELPYPLKNVHIKGNYNNGEGHSPETVQVEIDTLHAEIEESFIDARFKLTNLKDPEIDAHLISRLELGHLVKPNGNIFLAGIILADLIIDGKISELEAFHLEGKQKAIGSLHVKDLELIVNDKKLKLELIEGASLLNNHILEVTSLVGAYNESAFHFKGLFENLDQFILSNDENLEGSFVLDFDRLDLREVLSSKELNDSKERSEGVFSLDGVAMDLEVFGNEILTDYGALKDFRLKSSLENNFFQVSSMSFSYQEGLVTGSGNLQLEKAGISSVDADIKGEFKNLILDFPKGDKELSKKTGKPFHLPEYIKARIDLIVDKGSIKKIPIRNLQLIAEMKENEVALKKFNVDVFEGHASLDGLMTIDSLGINEIEMNGALALDDIDLDALISEFNTGDTVSAGPGTIRFPDKISLNMDMKFREVDYKDFTINNFSTHIDADEKQITISELYTDLPFGSLRGDMKVDDYQNDNRTIIGSTDIVIDSLSIDRLMGMKALGVLGKDNRLGNMDLVKEEEKEPGLPDYINLKINVEAGYLAYKNASITDLDLAVHYSKEKIELNTLTFIFANGAVDVHGYIIKDNPDAFPGYLFSKVDDLDIGDLLRSFDNFEQDKFTADNSSGKISWAADSYFELDENLAPKQDGNLWIINTNVHQAEFDKVEPIEKTLFFVGHKSKDKMIVNQLNINAILFKDMLYFKDVLMNDNIANLDMFGEVNLDGRTMDIGLEISLSDLFFRSKSKRIVRTNDGEVDLEKDSKLFLSLTGPLADHKLKLINKRKFNKSRDNLTTTIRNAEKAIKGKKTQ